MPVKKRKAGTSLHCSLDQRAWTDLVTNSTLISGVDLTRDFARLASLGNYPIECLPTFLHESAHHSCFLSAVGSALSTLKLRMQAHIAEPDPAETGGFYQDFVRYETAVTLFRPLSEALALWAEFDLCPSSNTPVASIPAKWSYFAFTDPTDEEVEKEWGLSLIRLLMKSRLSKSWIRRKANLLMAPMSTARGGYLPGYLALKAMWRHAAQQSPWFFDTDCFFMFIRRFFYGDYGFVECLLREDQEALDAAQSLVDAFLARITLFFTLDLRAAAESLEREELEHYQAKGEAAYGPFFVDPDTHQRGRELLRSAVENLAAFPEIGAFQRSILAQRHILLLGSTPVELQLTPEGKIAARVGDQLLVALDALSAAHGSSLTSASLDIYLNMSQHPQNYTAVVLSSGDTMVALSITGNITPQARSQFETYIGNRRALDKLQTANQQRAETYFDSCGIRSLLDRHREYADTVTVDTYARIAYRDSDPARAQDLYRAMEKDGIFSLVNHDLKLLHVLAAGSIASSFFITCRQLETFVPGLPMSLADALPALDACAVQHGMPLIGAEDGRLGSSV